MSRTFFDDDREMTSVMPLTLSKNTRKKIPIERALLLACQEKKWAQVDTFIKQGVSLEHQVTKEDVENDVYIGFTPLHYMVMDNQLGLVNQALSSKVKLPSGKASSCFTPLSVFIATYQGDFTSDVEVYLKALKQSPMYVSLTQNPQNLYHPSVLVSMLYLLKTFYQLKANALFKKASHLNFLQSKFSQKVKIAKAEYAIFSVCESLCFALTDNVAIQSGLSVNAVRLNAFYDTWEQNRSKLPNALNESLKEIHAWLFRWCGDDFNANQPLQILSFEAWQQIRKDCIASLCQPPCQSSFKQESKYQTPEL